MQKLSSYLQTVGFSGEELERILRAFTYREVAKNELIVEYGKVSKHIGFVESGMFQYFVLKDGEERTTYVNIENTFLASLLSFVSGSPSLENIRALVPSAIALISKQDLKQLVDELPSFKNFYIVLLEQSICGIDASRHDLIVLSAEQRYEKMLKVEPHLLQHIPLQHLASMLGITPRHLSRIRNSIR